MEIQKLKGVGPKIANHLKSLGIYTIEDALRYYPRDYEDRSQLKSIKEIRDNEFTSLIAEVSLIYPPKRTATGKSVNKIVFRNETGFITALWFNQPYIKNNFKIGEKILLYGKTSKKLGEIQIIEPQYERNFDNLKGLVPVYSTNRYLSQKSLRKIISQSMEFIDSELIECLPESLRKVYEVPDIKTTISNIHFPSDLKALSFYRKRIKFEELLTLQLALFLVKKRLLSNDTAYSIPVSDEMKNFKDSLLFSLTEAQSRTIREILVDMKKAKPMNRLLQGDVGSGKTIIAVIALFNCAINGFQGAMMAPTEILAEQHYYTIKKLTDKWNISVELITGSTPKKLKEDILKRLQEGKIDIIIGTHALIQENVEFKNLALVITDEQHRFGVRQRAELVNKGHNPHVLVMTATPIPRTLAIFLYGDMDISIIDELPPGRQGVDTRYIKTSSRDRVYSSLKREIDKGRQAYVVCPLVEESENLEAESAIKTAELLKKKYFTNYKVGLLYGKMSSLEKEEVMKSFKEGEINILVSTTVIEVGVNVPNATVMIIENAERFGLAQLHQLRGRVGRGEYKSYCILISDAKNEEATERMKIMKSTNDGFVIAEKDMELRGTGEFFGTKQHGLPELKMADIVRDIELLKKTRDIAREITENDYLKLPEFFILKEQIYKILNNKMDDITFN